MRLRSVVPVLIIVVSHVAIARAGAQSAPSKVVSIEGTVVDAGTALPIDGAVLTLVARGATAVLPPRGGSPLLTAARTATSNATGQYALRDISTGNYQLFVRRLGYEATTVDVDLAGAESVAHLSIGLVVVPVRLRALEVRQRAPSLYGRALDVTPSGATLRVAAARARQQQFIGTDVREVTYGDALEASGYNDGDLFRALRRLPGVSGIDDYTTELWVRGTRWDQTRVYFDGLPLLDPFHMNGRMAGVSGDAIGAAFLHSGVRGASLPSQGASLIDIHSRAAGADSAVHGAADLSLQGASASLDRRTAGGRVGVTASGRRSLYDVRLAKELPLVASSESHYSELATRVDADLGGGRTAEASTLWTKDYAPQFYLGEQDDPGISGSGLGRITFRTPLGRFTTSQTLGFSSYDSRLHALSVFVGTFPAETVAYLVLPFSTGVDYVLASVDITPTHASPTTKWSAGYQQVSEQASYTAPGYTLSVADQSDSLRTFRGGLRYGTVWGDLRWSPSSRLSVETGVRADVGTPFGGIGKNLAPSLQAQYSLSSTSRLSAGLGRSFQDAQKLGMGGVWLMAGRSVPRLVADQVNVGVDHWYGESILLNANLYGRAISGVIAPLLANGDTTMKAASVPSEFYTSDISAYGAEVSIRKLAGRATGSIGYGYGRATERGGGVTSLASADRTHSLDASGLLRLGRWRLGTAYALMSGAPFTRLNFAAYDSSLTLAQLRARTVAEARNAHRLPALSTIDVFAEWIGHLRRVSFAPYIGMQSIAGSRTNTVYGGKRCLNTQTTVETCANPRDLFFARSGGLHGNLGLRIVF